MSAGISASSSTSLSGDSADGIDGKPAAGVKVTAVPGSKQYRSSEMVTTVETGADGIATIAWPTPGMYWIDAQAEDANPAEPRATKRRMGYTFTAEVVAP